jgi:zinc protease
MFIKLISWVLGGFFLGATLAWAAPKIERWQTANGAKVYYVHNPELPLVDLRVVVAAGSTFDGEKHGLAALTSALLDKGAGSLDADAIARSLENAGARLDSGVARDFAWLHLRSLTEPDKLKPAVSTLREVISSPRFAEEDFAREKQRLLLALKQREESPEQVASIQFFKAVYGDHPYAHPPEGEIETVTALKREDLQEFHRKFYVAKNSLVVIVGALSRGEAERVAEQLMQSLPSGESAPEIPEVQEPNSPGLTRIAFSSAQTHILTGMAVLRRNDPDYFPLYVGNHVLGGGGFTSRLVKEVREKRGLSYGVASYFLPLKRPGPFLASLQTKNDQAQAALEVLTQTLETYLQEGPTEAELAQAKRHITGSFVLNYDSNAELADYAAMIGFYELPLDYLDTFTQRVEAVTRQQIMEAFRRRLDPKKFRTVLVGGES